MSIVVLGAVFVDIKGYPTGAYIPGGRNAGRVEQVHGGVSRNIAEDIANLELRPVFIGLVDETGIGEDVVRKLKNHKVDTSHMRRVPDGMGTWLAVFDDTGDVTASISKRPDLSPINDILDEEGDEIFRTADSVLLEIDMETPTVQRVLKLAQKYHVPVYAAVSNMSIAVKRRDLLRHVDCLVCNRQEAGIFFSHDYSSFSPVRMADELASAVYAADLKSMVVTMGGDGAVYADVSGARGVVPAMNVAVRDTTGAGDAFFAGVAAGLTYHKTL